MYRLPCVGTILRFTIIIERVPGILRLILAARVELQSINALTCAAVLAARALRL